MGLTGEVENRLAEKGAGWIIDGERRVSFGRYFTALLESKKISKGELADAMTYSPFNAMASRESIMTKLGRWLSGKAEPEDRDLMFQLCIHLSLSPSEARELFEKGLRASWVHPANRSERIYEFCIDNGFGINAAHRLINTDYGAGESSGIMDGGGFKSSSMTNYLKDEYDTWAIRVSGMERQEKLNAFEAFLRENNDYFHSVRETRRRHFARMVEEFRERFTRELDTDEAEIGAGGDGNILYKMQVPSNTMLADMLRDMRVPSADDIEDLGDEKKKKRVGRLVYDQKKGDSNPIRKDIPLYLSGRRDIPRDIFIKTYILSCAEPDFYDLEDLLMESGYPSIYVRSADGFDALVYHVFWVYDNERGDGLTEEYMSNVNKLRELLEQGLVMADS